MRQVILLAGLVASMTLMARAAGEAAVPKDDFSWMRGANYVPSYSRNDLQTWLDFDPAVIDRELGHAEKLKLNTVRVFLNYAVHEKDPKVFLARFEQLLALCQKHGIRLMPVLFDSCFGEFPDLEEYREKDWMAGPGQNRIGPAEWPKLEQYVRDVVGGHRDDRRIVMWDVMNEPWMTSFNTEADQKAILEFLRHFLDFTREQKPSQPLTVGLEFSTLLDRVIDKVDVLCFHNYQKNLREDIRGVKELGAKHGKPAIINEVVMRPHQPFQFAMPILAEEKIGFCFWELMLGKTQFSRGLEPIQGIVYPDGTCSDPEEVMAVLAPGQKGDAEQLAASAGLPARRWSGEKAWNWYKSRPWIVGFNYVPSTACNTTELWQAETFDERTIDRELGWAQGLGFNSCRVFVQYLVWKSDPEGLRKRVDRFLQIADGHGLSAMLVLFDDCAFGDPPQTEPYLGKQRDPIPGMILPGWTPSPGLKAVTDRSAWPDLEKYVTDVVGSFAEDKRVLVWDLYNEPGNEGKSLPLVEATFRWARAAKPSQPLTMGVWSGHAALNEAQFLHSDILSYHHYGTYESQLATLWAHKRQMRPVISTEWMARPVGSKWQTDLPLFKQQGVGCYSWGLVNGRTQCQFAWGDRRGTPEPKVWFHDLFHQDGRPYDAAEHEVIRKTTADKTIDWTEADYSLAPGGEMKAHRKAGIAYGDGWTWWLGDGPREGYLHYNRRQGGEAKVEFEASKIFLVHKTGPDCGIAELIVDGKPGTTLDTYSAEVEWNQRTPVAEGLTPGRHTLTIRVTGRKNDASTDCYVQIVGFAAEP